MVEYTSPVSRHRQNTLTWLSLRGVKRRSNLKDILYYRDCFAALGTFKDITELQKCQAAETEVLKNLTKERSSLTGEIAGLAKQRDTLRGEIEESASSAVKEITDTGEKAVIQLRQQAEGLKGQLDGLFAQALRVAGVTGEMKPWLRKAKNRERASIASSKR
ncbi:MAG: hypothetical protein Q8O05_02820 [Chloroflexota bacterium]|nr:hypothetical protein [Chloroflexota bacterium]